MARLHALFGEVSDQRVRLAVIGKCKLILRASDGEKEWVYSLLSLLSARVGRPDDKINLKVAAISLITLFS